MSKLVDERVVEMRFDNSNFERNTRQSMSTLQKLKASLNFSAVNKSINSVDMSPIEVGLAKAEKSFSAWEVASITAISRVTNKIIDLGVQLVKSLSVDNITSGWAKFTEQTKTTGTIISQLSNTTGSIEEAGKITSDYMEKLQWYSDATSYSLTDMTNAISKFIGKGEDMETSFNASVGIANWAASAGKNAQEAQIAFNALSKVADHVLSRQWTSIQLGTMDTLEFKNAVLEAAVAEGTLTKSAERLDGTIEYMTEKGNLVTATNFTEYFADEWFNTKVLMNVLGDYGKSVDEVRQLQNEMNYQTPYEALDEYTKRMKEAKEAAIEQGDATAQAEAELGLFSAKAFKAASEARTLEDAINAVKDAVSTGWLTAFQKVIGNYEQATEFFSEFADILARIFTAPTEAINKALDAWTSLGGRDDLFGNRNAENQGAFWNLTDIIEKLIGCFRDAMKSVFHTQATFKTFTEYLKNKTGRALIFINNHAESITNIFRGLFAILKLGYKILQGIHVALTPIINAIMQDSGGIVDFLGMLGAKFADWVDRTQIFLKIGTAVGNAISFIISSLRELKIIERITSVFKGFFEELQIGAVLADLWNSIVEAFNAILDVTLKAIKGILTFTAKYVIPALSQIIKYLGILVGIIAGVLIKGIELLFNWIKKLFDLIRGSETIQNAWKKFVSFLQSIPDRLKKLGPFFTRLGTAIANFFKAVWNALTALGQVLARALKLKTIGEVFALIGEKIAYGFRKIVEGIKSLFQADYGKSVDGVEEKMSPLQTFFKGLIDLFKGVWAIFKALLPFIGKILSAIGALFQTIANSIEKTFTKDVSPGSGFNLMYLLQGGIVALLIKLVNDFVYLFKGVTAGIYSMLDGIGGYFRGKMMLNMAKAMKEFALAILLFIAAIAILGSMDVNAIKQGVFVLSILLGMMTTAIIAISKFAQTTSTIKWIKGKGLIGQRSGMAGVAAAIIAMSASMLILVAALRWIDKLNKDTVLENLAILAALMLGLSVSIGLMNMLANVANKSKQSARGIRGVLSFAIALWMMAEVCESLGTLPINVIWKSIGAIAAISLAYGAMVMLMNATIGGGEKKSLFRGNPGKGVGKMLVFAGAMMALVPAIETLGKMDKATLWQAVGAITAISLTYGIMGALLSTMDIKSTIAMVATLFVMKTVLDYTVELINGDTLKNLSMAAVGKFSIIMLNIIAAIVVISESFKMFKVNKKSFLSLLAFATLMTLVVGALFGIATSLKIMEGVSLGTTLQMITMLGVLLTSVYGIIEVSAKVFKGKKLDKRFAKTMMILGGIMSFLILSMFGIAASLKMMEGVSLGTTLQMITMLGVLVAASFGIIKVAEKVFYRKKLDKRFAKTMGILATIMAALIGTMFAIAYSLKMMEGVSLGTTIQMLWMLGALLAATFAIVLVASKIKVNGGTITNLIALGSVLIVLVGSIAALAGIAKMMQGVSMEAIGKTLLLMFTSIGAAIGIVALAAAFSGKLDKVTKQLIGMSSAFLIFAYAVYIMAAGLKAMQNCVKGLIIFAGALVVLWLATKLMSAGIGPLLAVAAAFGIMGVAVLALGAGFYLTVMALNELLPNLDALAEKSDQLETVISSAMSGVAKGLANALPDVIKALSTAVDTILQSLGQRLMAIFDWIKNLKIEDVMEVVDKLLDLFFNIVLLALKKLAENIGPITNEVINILIGFIDTVAKRLPELANSLLNFVLDLIDGLGQAIEDNAAKIRDTMIGFCQHLWNAFLNFFGIHSPSTKTKEAGENIMLGIIKGIGNRLTQVVKEIINVGVKMLREISKLPKQFMKIGVDILKGFLQGLRSVVKSVLDFFKGLWEDIKEFFGWGTAKDEYKTAGKETMMKYKDGLEEGEMDVNKTAKAVIDGVVAELDKSTIFKTLGETITEFIATGVENSSGVIAGAIKDACEGAVDDLWVDYGNLDSDDVITKYLDKLVNLLESELDEHQFTITPVMDLTDIQEKTALAAAMVSTIGDISLSGSNALAERTANDISIAKANNITPANNVQTPTQLAGDGNYYFTFNMYGVNDPKELYDKFNQILQHEIGKSKGGL